MRIKPKFNWTEIFSQLECDKYNPQGKTIEEGLHCFTLILQYLKITGHDVSFENELLDGYTHQNINERWNQDQLAAIKMCERYFAPVVHKISISDLKVGDMMVVQARNRYIPGIYCGNGKLFTMLEEGTVRINLALTKIVSVFRGNNI